MGMTIDEKWICDSCIEKDACAIHAIQNTLYPITSCTYYQENKKEIIDIQKYIKTLESLLSHYKTREQCEGYYDSVLKDNVMALDFAVDTMHKYQKIQEIINNTDGIEEDVIRYKMICGVVEDATN